MEHRLDLWFSTWIVVWFLLFILGASVPSPTFALIIGNIAILTVILFFRSHFAPYKVELILISKVIPLIIMLNIEKETPIDPIPVAVLFIIYIIYLHLNGRTLTEMYRLEKIYK